MLGLILVTGASGLLGANLVLAARARGCGVVGVYQRHPIRFPEAMSVCADLTDSVAAYDLLSSLQPGWVVHCAAETAVDYCEEHSEEAWRINVEMSRNLAIAARRVGVRLLYISTDSVFDGETGCYSEEHATNPLNAYARSKLAGEAAVQQESWHSLTVRTNFYGWNAVGKLSLAEWALERLELQQRVPGFDDVVFTPILVNHLSEVLLDMMELELSGVYHVAGSQWCSKYEFAQALAEVFDLDKKLVHPISVDGSDLRATRPKNTALDTGKLSRALGRAMPDVRDGLKRMKELRDSGFVTRLKACSGA